ncbi:hypothetical protein PHO31112_04743 [Pandoraea horticolens]|uniref:Uncharacterized protein n=1 Tax=Pandoraea horticolens TaxID=2508298 RepID=A0A5E4YUE0_9BURK|nr:hypothetical protein [Pandoraea horticolens]VVE51820.1 hypothetical protein PHO31112_04743 [Pandoraea horticolens]
MRNTPLVQLENEQQTNARKFSNPSAADEPDRQRTLKYLVLRYYELCASHRIGDI